MLRDINEDNREHARRLLHCLAVAIRPLRVEELAEILTFDFDDVEGGVPKFHADWRWKDQEEAVLSTCSSLISVVANCDRHGGSRVVQFSHFSVKEFLVSDRLASSTPNVSRYHILPRPAHIILVQACLGFLLHSDDRIGRKSAQVFPLANYAAEHWVAHAQFEDVASCVKDGMRSLFDPDKRHLVAWLRIYDIDANWHRHSQSTAPPNPLYYASLCGFYDLVEHIVINHPQLVNTISGRLDSPLFAALRREHMPVAEFLLRQGGNVDVRGQVGRTPLHLAMKSWLHSIARILLEHGAEPNVRDDEGKTPLHLLLHGNKYEDEDKLLSSVQLLLDCGANVNTQAKDHTTPVLLAMEGRKYKIARVLLEHGAEATGKNYNGQTPLHLLLDSREYSRNFDYARNEILVASLTWSLLEGGADVNARDNNHTTPLLLAIQQRMYDITRVLLSRGANPIGKIVGGKGPLHLLLEGDFFISDEDDIPGLVRLLVDRGADVNALAQNYATPLLLATEQRMFDIARILLERGAEANVKNIKGKNPLHLLLDRHFRLDGDISDLLVVERLLLERGADVNAQDQYNRTPLNLASDHRSRPEVAQIIFDHANVESDRRAVQVHVTLQGE